ncbi:DUF1616 domain-containing protein [Nonomuraea lactucae]|uniref:DUF1616 domain-containing protein n=1 Tax=Nonomuraea lactucae TaxID=2249762 RepID=UPI000DE4B1DD|nr:DUF1616 domain-containing protein [Nonomuraea lactucae]
MTFSRVSLLLLAASGWLAVLVTETAAGAPLRVVVTMVFLLLCPGAAVIGLMRPLLGRRDHTGDAMESAALAFAISIGLGMIVSELYFLTATFTMSRALMTLAAFTTVAALGALVTTRRARRAPAPRREVNRRREPQDW